MKSGFLCQDFGYVNVMNSLGKSLFCFRLFLKWRKYFFIAKVLAKQYVYIHLYSVQCLCLGACLAGRGGWPWQPETHWLLFVPWYKGLGHFVNPESIGKSRIALTYVCFNHFACQTFLFYKFAFLNRGWLVFILFPCARETCVDSKAPAAQNLKSREVVCRIFSSFILSTAGAVQVLFLSSCFVF